MLVARWSGSLALAASLTLVGLGGSVVGPARPSVGATAPGSPAKVAPQGLRSLPAAAWPAVSKAIGEQSSAFFAHRLGAGFRLGGGGVKMEFNGSKVRLRADGVLLSMTVAGLGRGGRLERPGVVSLAAHANRVSLDRGGLSEWYAAGPLGIEQGFTLSHRPTGVGPVTLALAFAGQIRARQTGSGTVLLGQSGLRYGELSATDSYGQQLRTALELRSGRLVIRVWDGGARYPLRIDPLIQQGSTLSGTGEVGAGAFGVDVALSGDGNIALIGGKWDHSNQGAAWVFTRSAGTWTERTKLPPGADSGDYFGFSVALAANGNTALIGAPGGGSQLGSAWVFTRLKGTWTQQGPPFGSGTTGGFGAGVALSSDGNTALIGDPDSNDRVGAAWVFTRSSGIWKLETELTGAGETGYAPDYTHVEGQFGSSVALSADGNTALIGGRADYGTSTYLLGGLTQAEPGAVFVFTRSGGTWTQQGVKLTGTDTAHLGVSAALSANGNTAVIGADGEALVFTRSAGTWTQQGAKLPGFGARVALSSDGNTALIGGTARSGTAQIFTRSAGVWTPQGAKVTVASKVTNSNEGMGVALSSDGNTALIGDFTADNFAGAAWVFTQVAKPPRTTTPTHTTTTTTTTVTTTPTTTPPLTGTWAHLGDAGKPGTASLNGAVYALNADAPGLLYVGGSFTSAGGNANAAHIASWNGSKWAPVGSPALNGDVRAIASHAGKVYAGGGFTNAGGDANLDFVAEWDGKAWGPVCKSAGPLVSGSVAALQIVGSTLYIGGTFSNGGGIASADGLLACDLTTGAVSSIVTNDGDISGAVLALAADSHGTLYAGGGFVKLAGIAGADHLAAYADGHWKALGSGPTGAAIDAFVRSLATSGSDLYVGTDAKNVAGIAQADNVARWDGSAWHALGSDKGGKDGWFPASASISAITTSGSTVVVGGSFQNAGADPQADAVASFSKGAWHPLGSDGSGNGPLNGAVAALATQGGNVFTGGNFTSAGTDKLANSIASYPVSGA